MTKNSEQNQIAAKEAGAIMPLIALLEGNPIVRPDVGGALWSLAAHEANQVATSLRLIASGCASDCI
jgi:hypothetical protein